MGADCLHCCSPIARYRLHPVHRKKDPVACQRDSKPFQQDEANRLMVGSILRVQGASPRRQLRKNAQPLIARRAASECCTALDATSTRTGMGHEELASG